jgi:hypothetical protein
MEMITRSGQYGFSWESKSFLSTSIEVSEVFDAAGEGGEKKCNNC